MDDWVLQYIDVKTKDVELMSVEELMFLADRAHDLYDALNEEIDDRK